MTLFEKISKFHAIEAQVREAKAGGMTKWALVRMVEDVYAEDDEEVR